MTRAGWSVPLTSSSTETHQQKHLPFGQSQMLCKKLNLNFIGVKHNERSSPTTKRGACGRYIFFSVFLVFLPSTGRPHICPLHTLVCNRQPWDHSCPNAELVQWQRIQSLHELGFCITWKCSCQEQVHHYCTVKSIALPQQCRFVVFQSGLWATDSVNFTPHVLTKLVRDRRIFFILIFQDGKEYKFWTFHRFVQS